MKIPAPIFHRRWVAAVALIGGLFAAALSWFGLVRPLDQVLYDQANELSPTSPAGDIVIVAIDEASLLELGRWPWPREDHVELLRRLREAGSTAVAMDVLFAEPYAGYPEVDEQLAAAVAEQGAVVLPVFIGRAGPGLGLREMPPLAPVAAAAAGLGHVHIALDSDGVARSVFLLQGVGAPRWPHLSVALARVLGLETGDLPGEVDLRVLADPDLAAIILSRANLIPFMGPAGSVPQVPYVDVIKGRVPASVLRDKIVFVGATAAGHADNITTSLGQIPGVEINANIFQALRTGRLARHVSAGLAAALSLLIVAATVVVFTRLAPGPLLLAILVSAAAVLAAAGLALRFLGLWLSPAPVLVTLVLVYPLWNWLRLSSALDFIQKQASELEEENRRLPHLDRVPPPVPPVAGADPVDAIRYRLERAHSQVRQSHELLQEMLVHLPSGVILATRSGDILLCNSEARRLFGLEEGPGAFARVLDQVELLEPLGEGGLMAKLAQEGEHFHGEGRSRATGQELLCEGTSIGSEPLLLLFVFTDVSALKESEKRRIEALNFLSHDLRAPLTSVLALIESAREPGAGDIRDLLREIEKSVQANLSYAENFIQLARIEHSELPDFDFCDAHSLVDNAVSQLYHTARRRGIELESSVCDEDVWLSCSRDLLERALINLIDNALKHSPDGGRVTIVLDADDDQALFSVIDRGEGIDPSDVQRIFEEFQQGANARTGAGLGLRFVSAVASAHGGTIAATDNPGGGSVFTLRLPRRTPEWLPE